MADIITAGPIQWPLQPPCGEDGPADASTDQWELAQAIAVDWVWVLSGRKYGTFEVTFRPEWTVPVARGMRNYVLGGYGSFSGYYGIGAGSGFAASPIADSSHALTSAPLPGPVVSVASVTVDGVTLDPDAWELNGDHLLRVDGGQWYRFQDTTLPATEVGTWEISYVRGVPVPSGGQYAAGVLACEEAKRMCGDTKCRLPNNATQATRNGTSVSLDAKQPQLGFTTLREVDQWCRTVNPKGNQAPPFVWSPDLDPGRLPRPPITTT